MCRKKCSCATSKISGDERYTFFPDDICCATQKNQACEMLGKREMRVFLSQRDAAINMIVNKAFLRRRLFAMITTRFCLGRPLPRVFSAAERKLNNKLTPECISQTHTHSHQRGGTKSKRIMCSRGAERV